jgi:hypothetical protein
MVSSTIAPSAMCWTAQIGAAARKGGQAQLSHPSSITEVRSGVNRRRCGQRCRLAYAMSRSVIAALMARTSFTWVSFERQRSKVTNKRRQGATADRASKGTKVRKVIPISLLIGFVLNKYDIEK